MKVLNAILLCVVSTLVNANAYSDDSNMVVHCNDGKKKTISWSQPGSTTNCRSVGEHNAYGLEAHISSGQSVECYAQWGCGGDKIASFNGQYSAKIDNIVASCKLIDKNRPSPAYPSTPATPSYQAPSVYPTPTPAYPSTPSSGKSVYPSTPLTPSTPAYPSTPATPSYQAPSNSSTAYNSTPAVTPVAPPPANSHAAILFEQPEFQGIKHWIDGTIGECRGLSGVAVESVKMVAYAGADPTTAAIEDGVTLAFYDNYGCQGNLIGAVTGEQANINDMIQQCQSCEGCVKPMGGSSYGNTSYGSSYGSNGSSGATIKGAAYSVRFVSTGIDNKFYSMSYNGKDGSYKSSASYTAVQVSTLALSVVGVLFSLM